MGSGAFQKRWEPLHAGACLAAGAASVLLGSNVPLAAVGGSSLFLFYLRARPSTGTGLANAVTLARLVVLGVMAAVAPTPWGFVVVLVLDGLDGALARRLDESTPFGAHFDMETDALFVELLCVELVRTGLPAWVLIAGALRPVLVLARLAFPKRAPGERRSPLGRHAFLVSALALIAGLIPFVPMIRVGLAASAVLVLLISFSTDFRALRAG